VLQPKNVKQKILSANIMWFICVLFIWYYMVCQNRI